MNKTAAAAPQPFLRPADIKRQARVPYRTVIAWLESRGSGDGADDGQRVPYRTVIAWLERGHPRAEILPSINLTTTGKRKGYRIRPEDWEAFLLRLSTEQRARPPGAAPMPRPTSRSREQGLFRY